MGEERNARGDVAFIVFILSQWESVNPYLRKNVSGGEMRRRHGWRRGARRLIL